MSQSNCLRSWEVEAAIDGRITGDALRDLDSHIEHCEMCSAERSALHSISDALRQSARDHAPDELTIRRVRHFALRRADEAIKYTRPRRHVTHAFLVAALAIVGFVAVRQLLNQERSASPIVSVHAEHDASWSSHVDEGVERIELRNGTLEVVVHRGPDDRHVLLLVPDGVIEDLGTTFRVSVLAGRTTNIRVIDGAIVFRRRDQAPIRVEAGSTWVVPVPLAVVDGPLTSASGVDASPVAEAAHVPSAAHPAADLVSPDVARADGKQLSDARPDRGSSSSSSPSASAVASSIVGSAEDAAYLRVLDLLHEGRREEAKNAAREYLKTFPRGFRRPELERIAE